MPELNKNALISSARAMLRPVASFLLRCGLSWREFSELAKSVFVEVATDEYGIRGRPTNVSRVSLLTGISRKEVRRQRDMLEQADQPPMNKTSDATRLLSGWHQDRDFLNSDGNPRLLEETGDGKEFPELCRRYASEIPATTMLKELKRVGAVEDAGNGRIRARLRYYMPTQFDPNWIMNAGSVFADLGNNVNHNLAHGEDEPSRFMGRATEHDIDPAALPEFYALVEEHGQKFLEMVDDWLARHRVDKGDGADAERLRLGVGLFLIQDESNDENK
jgi:hypothetical protein